MLLPLWEGRHTLALFARFLTGTMPKTRTVEISESGTPISLAEEHVLADEKARRDSEKTPIES